MLFAKDREGFWAVCAFRLNQQASSRSVVKVLLGCFQELVVLSAEEDGPPD